MYHLKYVIRIERFTDKKYIKKDLCTVLAFAVLFFIVGFIENNLILSNNGLGLLQHINIWIFLAANLIIPFSMNKIFRTLKERIDPKTFRTLKENFHKNAILNSIHILLNFTRTIGFCFFVGNSLQNAKLINQLPFDYWDSINYELSYIVSRVYKLYLFAFFIPHTLIYVFVLIKSISEALVINDKDMEDYPIKCYPQFNVLCNFGLNALMIVLIPFVLFAWGVFLVHERFDLTSITTIIVLLISSLVYLFMYVVLIKRYYVSIIKYKKMNLEKINGELAKIHQYILDFQFDENDCAKLEVCLKKENYLTQIKERIDKLSRFPLIAKAIFTSLSPLIPTLLKIMVQLLNTFFKLEILDAIL